MACEACEARQSRCFVTSWFFHLTISPAPWYLCCCTFSDIALTSILNMLQLNAEEARAKAADLTTEDVGCVNRDLPLK